MHIQSAKPAPPNAAARRAAPRQAGFTLIELMVAVSILAVLAGVALLNIGTFFGGGRAEAMNTELHQVGSAVSMYRFDGNVIKDAFTVGPDTKGYLGPYLSGKLQYYWTIGADGSVTPGTGYLFSSDLNNLDGFTKLMGDWTAGGGVLSPTTEEYEHRLTANGGPWGDFTFETTAALVSGSGYGMYYRSDGKPNITGYVFQFQGAKNNFIVRKVVGGYEFEPFVQVGMPAGFQVNGKHDIAVSVIGDHHVIKVDGTAVMDFHDSQYSSGTVGLRSWNYSKINFTDFKVLPQ